MNWLGPAGIVGAGAVLATMVASSGSTVPETAVLPAPVPKAVAITPKPVEAVVVPKIMPSIPKVERAVAPVVPVTQAKPTTSNCHPSYSGCLKMNAGDYDCSSGSGNAPNYTGAVEVYGSDPFDLDRDNDGWGCE